jgi:hypothetical protein
MSAGGAAGAAAGGAVGAVASLSRGTVAFAIAPMAISRTKKRATRRQTTPG